MRPSIRFYTFPEIHNIQLVHGRNVMHHFPRHIHNSVSFGIVERGRREIEIRKQTFIISAGEGFIVNPGDPHACHSTSEHSHDYWVLSINPEVIQSIFADITGKSEQCPYFPHYIIRDQTLFQMIAAFAKAAQQADDLLRQESLLIEIVSHCLTHYAQDPVTFRTFGIHHQTVKRVRAYLEQHIEENVRLEELAAVAHLSPFHLNRIFQQEVGMPPYEYLVQVRIKRAQMLLKQGEPIASAAYSTGFADQSHFTRFFKRHVGITPGEYLQSQTGS
jgi:AraC-like DNA-binding protein